MADADNNKMTAAGWKQADTSVIQSLTVSEKANRSDLFNQIKIAISAAVKIVRGTAKGDDRYVKIVDLIMIRIRSALRDIDVEQLAGDKVEQITDEIEERLSELLSDKMLEGSRAVSNISIKDIFDQVDGYLKNINIKKLYSKKTDIQPDNKVTSSTLARAENIELETVKLADSFNEFDGAEKQDTVIQSADEQKIESIQAKFDEFKVIGLNKLINRFFAYQYGNNIVSDHFVEFLRDIDARVLKFQLAGVDIFHTLVPIKINKEKNFNLYIESQCFDAIRKQLDSISKVLKKVIKNPFLALAGGNKKKSKFIKNFGIHVGYLLSLDASSFGGISQRLVDDIAIYKAVFKKNMKLLKEVYKLVKPKNFLDRIMDWIKQQIVMLAVKHVFHKMLGKIPFIDYMKKRLGPIFDKYFKKIYTKVQSQVKGIISTFKLLFKVLKKIISAIWKAVKKGFSKTMRQITKTLKSLLKIIYHIAKGVGNMLWRAINSIFDFLKKKFGKYLKNIADKFKGFFKKLTNSFKKITSIFQKVKNFFGKIGKFFKNIKNIFSKMTSKIKSVIQGVKTKIINAIKTAAKKISNAVKTVVKKVVETVVKIVKKVIKKIVGYFKKKIIEIFKRIGLNFAKKMAKKKSRGIGIKILVKFFKKFLVKFITKLSTKIAASVAVNAIPILGQIISVCMMIWTIADTLLMVWDIYKLFKENPMLWDIAKEEVAKWAEKTFSFFKDLCEWGKKLFKRIIRYYKDKYHALGDAFFSSNKKMHKTYAENLKALQNHSVEAKDSVLKMKDINFTEYYFNNIQNPKIEQLLRKIEKINNQIFKEDDSWWRDTDQMTAWMNERQPLYIGLIYLLARGGIFQLNGFFDEDFIDYVRGEVDLAKKELKLQLEEQMRQAELARYKNVGFNYEELRKMLKELGRSSEERKEKISGLNSFIESTATQARAKLVEMFPYVFGDDYVTVDEDIEAMF